MQFCTFRWKVQGFISVPLTPKLETAFTARYGTSKTVTKWCSDYDLRLWPDLLTYEVKSCTQMCYWFPTIYIHAITNDEAGAVFGLSGKQVGWGNIIWILKQHAQNYKFLCRNNSATTRLSRAFNVSFYFFEILKFVILVCMNIIIIMSIVFIMFYLCLV